MTSFTAVSGASNETVTLYGITSGPDGALWYVGSAYSSGGAETPIVARMTTGGTVTDYSTAATSAGVQNPNSIVAGPDGALWFTDSNLGVPSNGHDAIGRITTTGSVEECPTPTQVPDGTVLPFGMAAGPDSAMWFTENQGNNIGRIPVTVTPGSKLRRR